MNRKPDHCPTRELPLLISDELSIPETTALEAHLETCPECRDQLESLAGDPSWWDDAENHLSGFDSGSASDQQWPPSSEPDFTKFDSVVVQLDSVAATSGGVPSRVDSAILGNPRHPEMLGRIGSYDVEQKIGQGGMGIVYRGFDTALNRAVAIKVLAPHLASSGIARKRFAREARAAAAVRHPNVVPIYNVNATDELPYIVMALVDGRSLQEHVQKHGPLETKDVVRIAHQIAGGLAAAHEQGLIHRDIKPANILIEKDVSRVMITDFGLARAADDVAMTQTGWLAGTPHYMSPEQARGKDIDHRSDLFSLGSLLYFIATGREPFRAEKPLAVLQKISSSVPIAARRINSDIPVTLDRIISGLLEKDSFNRPASASELQQTLAQYLAHLQHPQSNPRPAVKSSSRGNEWLRPILLALSTTLMLVLAVSFAWNSWTSESPDSGALSLGATIPGPNDSQMTATSPASPPALTNDAAATGANWMDEIQPYQSWLSEATELEEEIRAMESRADQMEPVFPGIDRAGPGAGIDSDQLEPEATAEPETTPTIEGK